MPGNSQRRRVGIAMAEPRFGGPGTAGHDALVVVPELPGQLIHPDIQDLYTRDELDDLIDELFPDTDDRPGWFDVGLLIGGLGLLGWGTLGRGSTVAVVIGAIATGLGCILPARSAWRRFQRARRGRHRSAALARGLPMRTSGPTLGRLVRAYEALLSTANAPGLPDGSSAIAAGHSAVMEAASLLQGRLPTSDGERAYIEQRAAAIAKLAEAIHEQQAELAAAVTAGDEPALDVEPAAMLLARAEVDAIAGFNSLTRLDELTSEARARREPF